MRGAGKTVSSELIPNGAQTKVTKENRLKFMYLLADFKLYEMKH